MEQPDPLEMLWEPAFSGEQLENQQLSEGLIDNWNKVSDIMNEFTGEYESNLGSMVIDKCTRCTNKKGICQTFRIYGPPIPWTGPRLSRSKTHMYDAQKRPKMGTSFEIRRQFENVHENGQLLEGVPLILSITFAFKPPRTNAALLTKRPHYYKPDNSNCVAYIEDVCTGLLYRDDCQISAIFTCKKYDIESYTEFKISVIGE